jgi:hypothetical protein
MVLLKVRRKGQVRSYDWRRPKNTSCEAWKGGMKKKMRLVSIPKCSHQQEITTYEILVSVVESETAHLHSQSHQEARLVLCKYGRKTRWHLPLRFSYSLPKEKSIPTSSQESCLSLHGIGPAAAGLLFPFEVSVEMSPLLKSCP